MLELVTIGAGVKNIGEAAFANNQLKSVIIPDSVRTIGKAAFRVNKLELVTIPSSVESIGISAFHENKQLSSVEMTYTLFQSICIKEGSLNTFFNDSKQIKFYDPTDSDRLLSCSSSNF